MSFIQIHRSEKGLSQRSRPLWSVPKFQRLALLNVDPLPMPRWHRPRQSRSDWFQSPLSAARQWPAARKPSFVGSTASRECRLNAYGWCIISFFWKNSSQWFSEWPKLINFCSFFVDIPNIPEDPRQYLSIPYPFESHCGHRTSLFFKRSEPPRSH